MNYKRFKKYIVVDENNVPMTYFNFGKQGGQFCYADSERSRRPKGLEIYSYQKAKELIAKTLEFRKAKNFDDTTDKYFLMPIK